MKRLDDSTLERIAETICGSGPDYSVPGPYRSKSEIYRFLRRAGVEPQGQSSTRKWFVLESLQVLDQERSGSLLPASLDKVLVRLASPQEYGGDAATTQAVIENLNQILLVEGLQLSLVGVQPRLQEKAPGFAAAKPTRPRRDPPPNFEQLVGEPRLAKILSFRWDEAQRCVESSAHLAAVVMMGSILEGVLFYRAESNLAIVNRAKAAPKDRTGSPKPLHEWSLSHLIDVAHEVGWLQGDVKRFSHALRDSRNIVHPYVQRLQQDIPDEDTCSICWQVVRAAVSDLLAIDEQIRPETRK